jgi:predicted nucleotidyltransferase
LLRRVHRRPLVMIVRLMETVQTDRLIHARAERLAATTPGTMKAVGTPRDGLAALQAAAESGELDELCARHRVRILTVFGSAARGERNARDLDIGVMFEPDADPDYYAIIGHLMDVTDTDIDFVHLNRGGPVIRERALVGSIALFESEPGALASAQIAAVLERMDTDWMRRLDLELMAG